MCISNPVQEAIGTVILRGKSSSSPTVFGYHQIEGQAIEIIKKGSVVKCPPNVRHWHGASADVGLQQLYIVPNTEKGIVSWKEGVTDEVYKSAK